MINTLISIMLHKIFNRKTLKISYSCMNNLKKIINTHNTEVIRKYLDQLNNSSNNNCKTKINCPMNGMCNLKNVVYKATIFPKENVKDKKIYIGILSLRWNLRYNDHIHSFSHECLRNQTVVFKHFWKLKNMGLTPKIQ